MLTPIYEGRADVRYSCDAAMTAGKMVRLDPSNVDKVIVAVGVIMLGFAAETNQNWASDYSEYRSPIKPVPDYGDKIGVYVDGGSYKTDQFVNSEAIAVPGAALYCSNAGLLTATSGSPSSTEGNVKVGYVVKRHSSTLLEFESIL